MTDESETIVLNEAERACLLALRDGKTAQSISIEAKLVVKTAGGALSRLAELGLAERDAAGKWLATPWGRTCEYEAETREPSTNLNSPDVNGDRLRELLIRPMRGAEIVRAMGLSAQGVRQLLIRAHARGRVAFGDPRNIFWLVKRADDPSFLLSRDEERVLSALPRDHAAGANGLRTAARLRSGEVEPILERLMAAGLAEAFDELRGGLVYRVTATGWEHPQCARSLRPAPPPRLPLQSDRVRNVLRAIADSGALRIKDLALALGIPQQSVNALMQYLKRRQMVATVADEPRSPYGLTELGRATLAEMTLRRVA